MLECHLFHVDLTYKMHSLQSQSHEKSDDNLASLKIFLFHHHPIEWIDRRIAAYWCRASDLDYKTNPDNQIVHSEASRQGRSHS